MIAYLDSSAIAKAYLTGETGRDELEGITRAAVALATSRFSYVEVRAALAAARRAGRLTMVVAWDVQLRAAAHAAGVAVCPAVV